MFKYVLKRLGLSLIVLLGVSVIIYFLVRLMPTNYLETKFSAQIQQGTITHEQLDEFKKRYGLYMPDAYLDITIDHESISDVTFSRDTRSQTHADLENEIIKHNRNRHNDCCHYQNDRSKYAKKSSDRRKRFLNILNLLSIF